MYAVTEPSRLFCSRDGGDSWEKADAGRYRLFAGLGDGTLLQSRDAGRNWGDLGERIGAITALAVT